MKRPALSTWQRRALDSLRAQRKSQPDLIYVGNHRFDDHGNLWIDFTVNTQDLPSPTADGLTFKPYEEFALCVEPTDDHPPTVVMQHHRFMGIPHVLSGFFLCLYLDVAREWNPQVGIDGHDGVLNRLWDWMTKATQNQFNPQTALYHAVGGVPHVTIKSRSIVVRALPPRKARATTAYLHQRTEHRLDLTLQPTPGTDALHTPVFFADFDMPIGVGNHLLRSLLLLVRHPRPFGIDFFIKAPVPESRMRLSGLAERALSATQPQDCDPFGPSDRVVVSDQPSPTTPDAALFTALVASASRNPPGAPQRLILGVPHPVTRTEHLLALELNSDLADSLRGLVKNKRTPLIEYAFDEIHPDVAIEWCYLSDEREIVTTRRDATRPVSSLMGKRVVILGCGGLGSWLAEFVTRAGATEVVLSDSGRVTGGLLVRQNYAEEDDGNAKSQALGVRIDSLSDAVQVKIAAALTTPELIDLARTHDLIIDATVSLKMTNQLDEVAVAPTRRAVIAQVATDVATGTLGYAIINPTGSATTITQMDHHLRDFVRADGALERYRSFWEEPKPEEELVPTRGCSAPTFHGSAADLAALSGGLISLIAKHLVTPAQGSHLIALPHSDVQPSHTYVPFAA